MAGSASRARAKGTAGTGHEVGVVTEEGTRIWVGAAVRAEAGP